MRIRKGSIWDPQFGRPAWRVIPVNIGWKKGGENVMGRGVAREAAARYPELPLWWGRYCRETWQERDPLVVCYDLEYLILFPTKPLDKERPWLSWKQQSDLGLIEKGLEWLTRWSASTQSIVTPLLGCGNGGLDAETVLSLMLEYFDHDDGVTLVVR